jgi:N-acetylglucosaminyldiphosphoundecaprenol N-acetyl-beta-D-mannosaminyltransferase
MGTPPPPPSPPAAPPTQALLGIPLALTDYDRTLEWIDAMAAAGHRGYVCVAAVHTVMASQEDPALREAVLGASFTVPDGQPLVWALNALGHRLGERVYGPELMDRACARAAHTGLRFYLYGGQSEGALERLRVELQRKYPGLRLVGGHSPPFRELTVQEEADIAEDIERSGADVVWVGIGVPKQEKWMAAMRPRLTAPVLVGVGAAFDFHAGLVRQAPQWVQRAGLEWLFRLAQEPDRLWRRYLRYNPRFVAAVLRQYARARRAHAG